MRQTFIGRVAGTVCQAIGGLFEGSRPAAQPRTVRLGLEGLEVREVPAVLAATGGLAAGGALVPDQYVASPNGAYRLTLQTDGNMTLKADPAAASAWATRSSWGQNPSGAVMRADGNFVVLGPRAADGSAPVLWQSNTAGNPGAALRVQDDGKLFVVTPAGGAVWAPLGGTPTGTAAPTPIPTPVPTPAAPAVTLTPGQSVFSANGQYRLTLQTDGNLVVKTATGGTTLWATRSTWGQNPSGAVMRADGNFVVLGPRAADGSAPVLWQSNTAGNTGAALRLLDDGRLTVVAAGGAVLWSTADAAPPAPTPTPAPTPVTRTYTVRSGDTLSGIAQAQLGDANRWQEIAQLNPAVTPNNLQVGAVLTLPGGTTTTPPPASTTVANVVGGQMGAWIAQAQSVLLQNGVRMDQMGAWDINTVIQRESSGNPNAINLWDTNAQNGTPSKGLMQVIDPTFAAYDLPGYGNVWDPVSNIIAGVRYAVARYGSVWNVPGLVSLRAGGPYVGY